MSIDDRTTVRLAWALGLVAVLLAATGMLLAALNQRSLQQLLQDRELAGAVGAVCYSLLGVLIAARHRRNPIGWICAGIGLSQGAAIFAAEYATYALVTKPATLPGGALASWATTWVNWPSLVTRLTLFLLLFPSGRLLSRRWRLVVWLAMGSIVAQVLGYAVWAWPLRGPQLLDAGWVQLPLPVAPIWSWLTLAGGVLFAVSALPSVASVGIRLRRATGVERQQVKWFAYAGAITLVSIFFGTRVIEVLATSLLPIATGIAIFRYRLYDIDRIINRTLVYGLLTALLGTIYASLVLVLGQLFGGIAAEPPSWAVAGATLAVAALFQPGRRRIQHVVDRRFNRRKYDAAKTIEAFSGRLREEVDLDTLSAELLTVVDQTMQPTRAWLWLRPSTRSHATPEPFQRA